MDITYPFTVHETISTTVLGIVALAAPAIIIVLVCLFLVPGPTVSKSVPRGLVWQRKMWEWYAGWTGLALSCALAWLITNGMKNLFGHWRPDMLSRCNPDVANIAKYAIGGFPTAPDGSYLVSYKICQTTDMSTLDDGFRSFPSGHASFSAAGLIYLSLFLASKLAITIPYLSPRPYSAEPGYYTAFPSRLAQHRNRSHLTEGTDTSYKGESIEMMGGPSSSTPSQSSFHPATVAARNQAATPPLYLLIFILVPVLVSIYITASRYFDFRHHGFDILFGFFIGTTTAIASFRFFHLPMGRGAGWAWGPRSRERAWWAGVGVGDYAGVGFKEGEGDGGLPPPVTAGPGAAAAGGYDAHPVVGAASGSGYNAGAGGGYPAGSGYGAGPVNGGHGGLGSGGVGSSVDSTRPMVGQGREGGYYAGQAV
jgi:membrane-associated phospholipid phosphatase